MVEKVAAHFKCSCNVLDFLKEATMNFIPEVISSG